MKEIFDKINKNPTNEFNNFLSGEKKETFEDELDVDYEKAEWKEYHENILVDWADKALCYRWLHSKSSTKYIRLRNLYTIPVIILSTLTGTANFALERVPEEYQSYSQIAIGSLNIFAAIITTVSQFLKINELSESHRVASISWDKFYRNIRVELVKSPDDRINVAYLIKSCKDEYDRLMETNPTIDTNIIKNFNKTFKFNDKSKKEVLMTLNKPEILDSLESTKNIVYKTDKTYNTNDNLINIIKKKKEELEKENMIDDFIKTFNNEFNRKPSIIEIYDNLDNKISQSILQKYLNSSKWLLKK